MTIKVGINGFGRIGRTFTRMALDRGNLDVVAVNDITDAGTCAHLLEFDSTFGPLRRNVSHTQDSLIVDGETIAVLAERDPAAIDWAAFGADIVVESTGKFRARDAAAAHLKGGARKVLISVPGKNADATIVLGVNDGAYNPRLHDVISNASCTRTAWPRWPRCCTTRSAWKGVVNSSAFCDQTLGNLGFDKHAKVAGRVGGRERGASADGAHMVPGVRLPVSARCLDSGPIWVGAVLADEPGRVQCCTRGCLPLRGVGICAAPQIAGNRGEICPPPACPAGKLMFSTSS